MNSVFASRITALRKDREISQKDAAADLKISQALLSHYEKGIRECKLEFVCRLADYYDVSCDYLLGRADTRRQPQKDPVPTDIGQDAEFCAGTLLRAAAALRESLAVPEAGTGEKLKAYYALCVYHAAACAAGSGRIPKTWLKTEPRKAAALSLGALSLLSEGAESADPAVREKVRKDEPLCLKTVIENSERILFDEFRIPAEQPKKR